MTNNSQQVTAVWQKWRFSASYDSFVVKQTFVLRMNICGENRHLRQAAKRYRALAKIELNMKINVDKTLEQIEKEYWPEPNHDSYLVRTCHLLRKKPIADFEIEDLRILISQNISLNVLVPIALDKLKENVLQKVISMKGTY